MMEQNKLRKIYGALEFSGVFIGVLKKPLFQAFADYMQADGVQKRYAYTKFVSVIYEHGGNLTELVKKLVFEDENIYIKSVARKETVNPCIIQSAERELNVFSAFGELKSVDFAQDLGVQEIEIPVFASMPVDMRKAYQERLAGIYQYGYGIFSSNCMFRLSDDKEIEPIVSADKVSMQSFIGYEAERAQIVQNTRAFLSGKPSANALLCGDAGTGKSSTVKAVANAFFKDGLRLIELRKDQLKYLPTVMAKISGNPLKFIIFIDDLAFNRSDDNFSMLKASLEGSASAKAENAVIYATSNRRHIIKESFSDRDGDDVHRNDTMQETLSLSERFGLVVLFQRPNKALYLDIVKELAKKRGLDIDEKELEVKAEAFALKRGSRSARCAEQFVDSL